jgi:hypothetical protein
MKITIIIITPDSMKRKKYNRYDCHIGHSEEEKYNDYQSIIIKIY